MTLCAYTDGACRGNPGESGIGIVVRDFRGATMLAVNGYLGHSTNNRAEYAALLTLLEGARSFPCTRLIVHSDSELVVRQVTGRYRVKDPELRILVGRVKDCLRALPFPVELRHISREMNREADVLANEAIDLREPPVKSVVVHLA